MILKIKNKTYNLQLDRKANWKVKEIINKTFPSIDAFMKYLNDKK